MSNNNLLPAVAFNKLSVRNGTHITDPNNPLQVTLQCNSGYRPDGPTTSLWNDATKSWNPTHLQCIMMTTNTLPVVENGVLEKVQRNGQDTSAPYQNHDTVQPKCYNGYEFKDAKAILLPNHDNSDLVWVPSTLKCKPMQTEERPKVENGSLFPVRYLKEEDYNSVKSLAYNDYVNLKCDSGYTSKQRASTLSVDKNNRLVWEPAVLSCKPMILATRPTIVGGYYFFSKNPPYIIGDQATVHCNPGSESSVDHAKVIMSANKLVWFPEQVFCQPMTLNRLPAVENGKAVLKKALNSPYHVGTQVTIKCDDEHSTTDPESEIVLDPHTGKLKWKPDNIRCRRVNCPEPPLLGPGGITISKTGRNFGDWVTYKCKNPNSEVMGRFTNAKRLEPIFNPSYKCNPDGKWTPKFPLEFHCIGVHCPELKRPKYANLKYSRVEDGIAIYTCVKDNTIFKRKCQANGTWSGQEPKCPDINPSYNYNWIFLIFILFGVMVFFMRNK